MKLGFTKSEIDECVFYRGSVMYILFKDDSNIKGPNQEELYTIVAYLKKENLEIRIEGTIEELLGVKIDRRKYGSINLIQPHLIEKIVKDLGQDNPKTTSKSTPAQPSKIFHSHKQSDIFNKRSHYRSVVVNFNYL